MYKTLAANMIRAMIRNLFPPTLKMYSPLPAVSVPGKVCFNAAKSAQSLCFASIYHLSIASSDFGFISMNLLIALFDMILIVAQFDMNDVFHLLFLFSLFNDWSKDRKIFI